MSSTTFNSEFGFSVKFRLKLDMDPLESLSVANGFGRTGFVVNVRDYLLRNADNEFYLCVAEYQNRLVVSSVGGDRNHLSTQPVEYTVLSNLNPDDFHTYLFVYIPGTGINLYVDGAYQHQFGTASLCARSVREGYYYKDFVALSLVNRSLNAALNEAGTAYVANATAELDYIRVYNEKRKQYNLIGIKEVETPEGHDHVSGLQKAYDSLTNKGVSSSAISCYYDTTFSPTRFESKLEGSSILVYRGHGGTYSGFGTGVLTNPSATAFEDRVFTSKDMQESLTDLTDTDLALFIGCETGYETTDIPNLVETAVSCGAETALGFRLTILCGDANTFTDRFFDFLVAGNTVLEAARNAAWLSNEEQERKVNFHDVYFSTSIQYFDMEGNSYYKLT